MLDASQDIGGAEQSGIVDVWDLRFDDFDGTSDVNFSKVGYVIPLDGVNMTLMAKREILHIISTETSQGCWSIKSSLDDFWFW